VKPVEAAKRSPPSVRRSVFTPNAKHVVAKWLDRLMANNRIGFFGKYWVFQQARRNLAI